MGWRQTGSTADSELKTPTAQDEVLWVQLRDNGSVQDG